MSRVPLSAVLALALALAGCGGWLGGGDDETPLEGERVSVFSFTEEVAATGGTGPFDLPAPVEVAAWPQQDANAANLPPHASYEGALEVAWRSAAGADETSYSRILSQPVIGEGRAYLLDGESRVVAFSLTRRRADWTRDLRPDGEHADGSLGGGVALDDGTLYVATPYGDLVALAAEDGSRRWTRSYGIPFRAAPTVRSERVYANLVNNRLVVLDAGDGSELWIHEGALKEGPSHLAAAAPAANDEVVIAPYSSGEIVALRADNGREAWRAPLARPDPAGGSLDVEDVAAGPVINAGAVFAAGTGGPLAALDLQTGQQLWTVPLPLDHTPRIVGGWIFAVTAGDEALCIARDTGEVRWVADLRDLVGAEVDDEILWTGLAVAGGLVVVTGTEAALALDPESGALVASTPLPQDPAAAPVAVGGLLYVLTREGSIVALR